ncbi:MAG: hypothetical protein ACE5KZ_11695 [Candidatus Scalinduaceae bacterium]
METNIAIIFSLAAYKIVSLLVGLSFSYMGFKLFIAGIWGKAGELDAQFGENKLILKKAAPGTFFVLFGTIIVGLTIWRGLEYKNIIEKLPHTPVPHSSSHMLEPLPNKLPFIKGDNK